MSKYIDTDTLIQELTDKVFNNYTDTFWGVMQAIDGIPAADVAPVRHGEWQRDDDTGESLVRCSVCREVYECEVTLETFAMFYHYCPNCGARMDGETE